MEFLEAFAARDYSRVEALLAPDAKIQWAWVEDPIELELFTVAEWLARISESTAMLDSLEVEILDHRASALPSATADAVSVSVRFRMIGTVGGRRFHNDGVDTLAFVRRDGTWRIVLSSSIEQLVFQPSSR